MVLKKHSMEFPRKVIIGENIINNLGNSILFEGDRISKTHTIKLNTLKLNFQKF